jgi:hypothetical protein
VAIYIWASNYIRVEGKKDLRKWVLSGERTSKSGPCKSWFYAVYLERYKRKLRYSRAKSSKKFHSKSISKYYF